MQEEKKKKEMKNYNSKNIHHNKRMSQEKVSSIIHRLYTKDIKGIVAAKISEDKIPEMLYPHTYMVKEIYEDENGERYITFKNPHNRSYNDISTDKIVSGNPGNTFTLPYNYVINELNITTILEEPVKNKRQYYKIPDDFQFIP